MNEMRMLDIFNAGEVTIQIDTLGHRVWICTEKELTVLRLARITKLTIDDQRLRITKEEREEDEKESDGNLH